MASRNAWLILKAENSQLYNCLKYERNWAKLRALMRGYLLKDKDRWTHWVNRLIQFKALEEVHDLLPIDEPRLSNELYTQCFIYFMRSQQFARFSELLNKLPNFSIEQEHLTRKMLAYLDENSLNRQLADTPEVLDVMYRLFMLEKNFDQAFQVMVKKRDPAVFEFVKRHPDVVKSLD